MSTVVFRYTGARCFSLPLPELFKDAFKIVAGGHQFSHQYAVWRAVSCLIGDERVLAWSYPFEELEGEFKCYVDEDVRLNLKFYFYNLCSEYLTNVFYRIQDHDIEGAVELLSALNEFLNDGFNKFAKPGYKIDVDVKVYFPGNPGHSVKGYSLPSHTPPGSQTDPGGILILNYGLLDRDVLGGIETVSYTVVATVSRA